MDHPDLLMSLALLQSAASVGRTEDAAMVQAACSTIQSLSSANVFVEGLYRCGGISLLENALQRHMACAAIVAQLCSTVAMCVARSQRWPMDPRVLLRCLDEHAADPYIVMSVSNALACSATDSTRADAADEAGAFVLLPAAVQRHKMRGDVVHAAVSALACIISHAESRAAQLAGVTALMELLRCSHDVTLSLRLLAACEQLAVRGSLADMLVESGCMETLADCIQLRGSHPELISSCAGLLRCLALDPTVATDVAAHRVSSALVTCFCTVGDKGGARDVKATITTAFAVIAASNADIHDQVLSRWLTAASCATLAPAVDVMALIDRLMQPDILHFPANMHICSIKCISAILREHTSQLNLILPSMTTLLALLRSGGPEIGATFLSEPESVEAFTGALTRHVDDADAVLIACSIMRLLMQCGQIRNAWVMDCIMGVLMTVLAVHVDTAAVAVSALDTICAFVSTYGHGCSLRMTHAVHALIAQLSPMLAAAPMALVIATLLHRLAKMNDAGRFAVAAEGIPLLLAAIRHYRVDGDVVHAACMALNIVSTTEHGISTIKRCGGATIVTSAAIVHPSDPALQALQERLR